MFILTINLEAVCINSQKQEEQEWFFIFYAKLRGGFQTITLEIFDILSQRVGMYGRLLESGLFCDCSDRQSTAEMTLCDCQGHLVLSRCFLSINPLIDCPSKMQQPRCEKHKPMKKPYVGSLVQSQLSSSYSHSRPGSRYVSDKDILEIDPPAYSSTQPFESFQLQVLYEFMVHKTCELNKKWCCFTQSDEDTVLHSNGNQSSLCQYPVSQSDLPS